MSALLDDSLVIVLAGGAGERHLSADQGARQAGGLFRRALPHHRLRPEQLHQLRACGASSSRRSTSRCRSTGTSAWAGASVSEELGEFRRDSPSAEAGQRALVSRDRRRGVPEPVIRIMREKPPAPGRALGRNHGLTRWTTRACCGCTMSGKPRLLSPPSRVPVGRRDPFRGSSRLDETERVHRLQEKPKRPTSDPPARRTSRSASMVVYILTPTCGSVALSRPTANQPTNHDFARTSSRR